MKNVVNNILQLPTFCKPINRAIWSGGLGPEINEGVPEARIYHSRFYSSGQEIVLKRIGIRLGAGYFKCGCESQLDWIRSLRVLVFKENQWKQIQWYRDLKKPKKGQIVWLDSLNVTSQAFILEVRESGVDRWWPSWDLAMTGVVLEVDSFPARVVPLDALRIDSVSGLGSKNKGLESWQEGETVRYRTNGFEVGFNLRHPSFSFFKMKGIMPQVDLPNQILAPRLFLMNQDQFHLAHLVSQGPRLWAVGSDPEAHYVSAQMQGSCVVKKNQVTYKIHYPQSKIDLSLHWHIGPKSLELEVERMIPKTQRVLLDSVWSIAFNSQVTPVAVLGETIKKGETGQIKSPFLLHAPRGNNFKVTQGGTVESCRYDAIRPLDATCAEWSIGNRSQPEGDYLLSKGSFKSQMKWEIAPTSVRTVSSIPRDVKNAIERNLPTAFAYRPDTATLSNNSTSIHCYFCLESWIELYKVFPNVHGISTGTFLRDTFSRWLDGAPSYASGRESDGKHLYEEKYLHSITATLYALSEYLLLKENQKWGALRWDKIINRLDFLKSLDLDGDGLIESKERLGISGEHQWSTNWWDVISFGWKDAFTNAFIYPLLLNFSKLFEQRKEIQKSDEMKQWADQFLIAYHQNFWNAESGWYAGWRCKKNQLHDYAFLFVNGAAVKYGIAPEPLRAPIMKSLYQELEKAQVPYHLGLPGNLWNIPDADLAPVMHGKPFGWYENGGLTLSQTKHFLGGMYAAGLHKEADHLIEKISRGVAEGEVTGGIGSGVDWRLWNGSPSGYEGLLVDQFGILAVAMKRWKKNTK